MKKWFAGLTVLLATLLLSLTAHAYYGAREGYTLAAEGDFDGLRMVSYSQAWGEADLAALYAELLLNVHGDELGLLGAIYLYPDSPEGVAGQYFEDVSYLPDGTLAFGRNAYIELFHMDRFRTAADAAPVLSHEYGHHYTIVNISAAENLHISEWGQSRYGALRKLAAYPVAYSANADYAWDIAEIAANDYVQLLSSPNARRSYDYPDAAERQALGDECQLALPMFNKHPQDNTALPLAAEVDGLYLYLLEIGGYTAAAPSIVQKPVIEGVEVRQTAGNSQYTLNWSPAESVDTEAFEYTAVMFPAAHPFFVEPLKTVTDGEALSAVFGVLAMEVDTGEGGMAEAVAAMDFFVGDYIFIVYAKDGRGFMFASEPLLYTFEGGADDLIFLDFEEPPMEAEAIEPMAGTYSLREQSIDLQTTLQALWISADISSRIATVQPDATRYAISTPTAMVWHTNMGGYDAPRFEAAAYDKKSVVRVSNSDYGGRKHDIGLSYSPGKTHRY